MKKRSRGGFTLVEVIVCIGVLAVISGFILQFFIISDRLNDRSSAVDAACVLAASVIEEYKGQARPELTAPFGSMLEGAQISATQDGYEGTVCYDKQWVKVPAGDPSAVYTLSARVTHRADGAEPMAQGTQGGGGQLLRGMYDISVRVTTTQVFSGTGSLANPLLVELSGARYFTWMEGGAQ